MDEALFTALCREHMPAFFRMACSILHSTADAEDAVQQALLRAWQSRSSARQGLERAWMMRIVINESITILRKRRRTLPTDDFPTLTSPEAAGPSALHEAIRALPESLRTPLLLKYMEGLTEREVATALRLSLPAVKNRLFRARKALQKLLNEEVSP